MRPKSFRVSIIFILLALILAYSILPVIQRLTSTYLTTYSYMAIVALTILIIVFGRQMQSINQYVSILLPFGLYGLLTFFTNNKSILMWGYQLLLSLLPVAMAYYIFYEKPEFISGLSKWLCVLFGVTTLTTIVGLIRYPFASRVLATIEDAQSADAVLYYMNNIGGYEFVYSLVLLYPLIILAYKRRKIPLAVMIVIAVAVGVTVFMSEYATALLLFLISSVLIFLPRNLSVRDMIIFAVCGILIIVFFSEFFSNALMQLADSVSSEVLKERLNALAGGRTGLESSESERIFLYRGSLEVFFENPLLGTMFKGGHGVGGHSQILDTLGLYGLVGAVIMVWMYRYMYAIFLKPFREKEGFGYVVWFFVQAILLSIINTNFWTTILVLYGPLILNLIYRNREEPTFAEGLQ